VDCRFIHQRVHEPSVFTGLFHTRLYSTNQLHETESFFWEASNRTGSQETALCVQKKNANITICQQISITSICSKSGLAQIKDGSSHKTELTSWLAVTVQFRIFGVFVIKRGRTMFLYNYGRCFHTWHCATNRKVAGSIPDGVIGIFHSHNPFGRTMALGSTQLITEMSARNIFWGVNAAGV
jgi:hypothetical protein